VSKDFLESIQSYHWPGNVRELINTLDCIYSQVPEGSEIFSQHLPVHIRAEVARNRIKSSVNRPPDARSATTPTGEKEFVPLKVLLDDTRAGYISDLMEHSQGNVAEACRISGLSRGHLYDLLKKYNIQSKGSTE
jgi:two-component system NtrC family response regulator